MSALGVLHRGGIEGTPVLSVGVSGAAERCRLGEWLFGALSFFDVWVLSLSLVAVLGGGYGGLGIRDRVLGD